MSQPVYLFSISSHPDACHVNSLDITFFRPEIDFSKYDALIITSKQASKALEQYDKKVYSNKPALCISVQSAKSFERLGGQVLGIGKGYGDTLSEQIKFYPKETKWLYLRAKVIASDFVFTCNEMGYNIEEKIVYASHCSQAIKEVEVEDEAVLIFTSPSSVECFLKNHTLLQTHKVIVIGKTTAKAIPKDCSYILSKDTTIENCMQIARSLK
ncbi:uroporphyrinogen-III synthase [Sulfurimonas sp.]